MVLLNVVRGSRRAHNDHNSVTDNANAYERGRNVCGGQQLAHA